MKLLFLFILCLVICCIYATSNKKSSSPNSEGSTERNTAKTKHNGKESKKSHDKNEKKQDRKTSMIRTPFDKVLDKLANCAPLSPTLVDVMQENLKQLQTDSKYVPLLNAAPHTAAYITKKSHDPTKFINGLRQALSADWSHPKWKSGQEIETLFRPFKQQFVYAMMRFNCT